MSDPFSLSCPSQEKGEGEDDDGLLIFLSFIRRKEKKTLQEYFFVFATFRSDDAHMQGGPRTKLENKLGKGKKMSKPINFPFEFCNKIIISIFEIQKCFFFFFFLEYGICSKVSPKKILASGNEVRTEQKRTE